MGNYYNSSDNVKKVCEVLEYFQAYQIMWS